MVGRTFVLRSSYPFSAVTRLNAVQFFVQKANYFFVSITKYHKHIRICATKNKIDNELTFLICCHNHFTCKHDWEQHNECGE